LSARNNGGEEGFRANGSDLRVNIWDTGGSEKFRSLAPMYYREAHTRIEELGNNGRKDVILIGDGNKADLADQRRISPGEIENFQFEHQLEYSVEVSEKAGKRIRKLFDRICAGLTKLPPLEAPENKLTDEYINGLASENKCDCSRGLDWKVKSRASVSK
jgi:Ras-related protein Rab-5C